MKTKQRFNGFCKFQLVIAGARALFFWNNVDTWADAMRWSWFQTKLAIQLMDDKTATNFDDAMRWAFYCTSAAIKMLADGVVDARDVRELAVRKLRLKLAIRSGRTIVFLRSNETQCTVTRGELFTRKIIEMTRKPSTAPKKVRKPRKNGHVLVFRDLNRVGKQTVSVDVRRVLQM